MEFHLVSGKVMRYILLFVLLFTPFLTRAQSTTYHPFPEDSATWVSDIYYNTCFGYCGSLYYEMYGDTLIGGQTYNKVFRREGEFYYITTPPNSLAGGNFSSCTYIGGIRQDISAKGVYFIDSTMTADTLLYDFDLSVGDTISDWYDKAGMQWPLEVASVDSIAINGNFHKRFNFVGFVNGMSRSLIEGIGWSGELFGMSTGPLEVVLACYNQTVTGNQAVFSECNLSLDCSLWVSDQIQDAKQGIKVFPNPFSDQLCFENDNHDETLLIVCDFTGRLLFEKPFFKSFTYSTESLQPGTYFYQLLSEKRVAQKGMVVKN